MTNEGRRLLADASRICIECDDCGRRREWRLEQIKALQARGVHTLGELAQRAICRECAPFRSMRNVIVRPDWRCKPGSGRDSAGATRPVSANPGKNDPVH